MVPTEMGPTKVHSEIAQTTTRYVSDEEPSDVSPNIPFDSAREAIR
jgi:hypothetical protein